LAGELTSRGWGAQLAGDGWLLVTNPAAADMKDAIGCHLACGGAEFRWSWGDLVVPAGEASSGDATAAADRITWVLRAGDAR
jgi:hypothetical protein